MKVLTAASLLFAALLCAAGNAAHAADDRFDPVRKRIRQQLEEKSIPSLTVAVAKDGKIVWEEGFGWADREQRIPADANTPYSLASISKPMTATGLMTLVRDGKLDLDRPVDDYLGAAKLTARVGDAREATVRRVANHTAGLPLHYQFFYADEAPKRPPMDETLRRYANLITPPGEVLQYSNLGYGVLDYVIARVSGQSYPEFMRTQVFQPLGLTHTSVDIAPELHAIAATRYGTDGKPLPFYDFDHPGGSAVFSSAHDLVRFGMFHLKDHLRGQKPILSDALIDQMHRPTTPADHEGKTLPGYGIGFAVSERGAYRLVSHTGSMGGVATQMLLLPKQDLAVVVLSNANTEVPRNIANDIVRAVLPDWPETPKQQTPEPFAATPALLGRWSGKIVTYTGEIPITLEFQPDGDIHARIGERMPVLIDQAAFEHDRFSGQLPVSIDTPDTQLHPTNTSLSLTLRGDVLNGAASSIDWGEGLPEDPRTRNALSHWIELTKQP